MIFDVPILPPEKIQEVVEFVTPYVLDTDNCIKICIYVPDGIDPKVRNEFIVYFLTLNGD